jgi:hypothetical protein
VYRHRYLRPQQSDGICRLLWRHHRAAADGHHDYNVDIINNALLLLSKTVDVAKVAQSWALLF